MKATNLIFLVLLSLGACKQNDSTSEKQPRVIGSKFLTSNSEDCVSANCQSLRKEFDFVVYTGKKIYCYWDLKKTASKNDFEGIAKNLKAAINDSTSPYEYYLILQKWAASLQDGHVNAMWGSDYEELESYKVPVRLELLAPGSDHETLIIAKSSLTTKKLPIGAIVTKINGKRAMERINEVEKYVSGSTPRMRRWGAANMIFSFMGSRDEERSAVNLEYTFEGKTSNVDLPRIITLPYTPEGTNTNEEIDYAKLIQVQVLANNIGYLRINGFSGADMAKILARTIKLLSHTKALVLDLRENGGGNQSGNQVLSWLTSTPIIRYHANLRISDMLLMSRGDTFLKTEFGENDQFTPFIPNKIEPQKAPYKGKVYALTSAYCFSACDTFVSALKENNLATIIGEGTGGGTGTPEVFELPYSGRSFRYSVAQGLTPVKKEFIEGVGTLPDITISPTVEERIANEDRQLLKAVNIAAFGVEEKVIDIKELENSGIRPKEIGGDSYSLKEYENEISQAIN